MMRHHRWGDDPRDPHPCEDCPMWGGTRQCGCDDADQERDERRHDFDD